MKVFDPTPFLLRQRIGIRGTHHLDRVFFPFVAAQINRQLREHVRENEQDYLWIFKGSHVHAETIRAARKRGILVLNYNCDDFGNRIHWSPYLQAAMREYDLIVTPRPHCLAEYRANARRVEYVNVGFDSTIHYPLEVSEGEKGLLGSQVAFVGSWSRRRQQIVSRLGDFEVKVWGSSWWRARPAFRRKEKICIMGRTAFCEEMSQVFNSSNININIFTVENRDRTNLRNFEIAACGAFQVSERSEELLEIFEEDKEVVCYGSEEELLDKCWYYLGHEAERLAIARAGHARVMGGGHTYLDRTKQILAILRTV